MRKKLISISTLFLLSFLSVFAFAGSKNHLAELNAKFPYGLLGDDHGVLTVNDLAINACDVEARPFTADTSYYPYAYWQCFESKSISFNCDSNGTSDKDEGVMGLIVLKISTDHIQHEYMERRLWPIKECRSFLKDAKALLKGVRYACISGSFIENETDHLGYQSTSWIFEKIKTKKGCEGHDCEFTKRFKQDNCPNMKL